MSGEGEAQRMSRAEWIMIGLNLIVIVFGGGSFWQSQQDQENRILKLEASERSHEQQMTQILVRLERIDANTTALKERIGEPR